MRRRLLLLFLALIFIAVGGALVWVVLQKPQKPPTIPYEAWIATRDPNFPLAKTKPDDVVIRNGDLLDGQDFVFTMGVGSGMYGLDVFRVDDSGNASYTFSTGYDDWWKRDFQISPAEVVKLRRLLVEVEYGTMARAYHANVLDGTQWCIRVDVNGATKQVYCNNYFPEAAERLADAVRQDLLPPHDEELRAARRIFQSQARGIAAALWR